MKTHPISIKKQAALKMALLTLVTLAIVGCKLNEKKWIDKMITEMETAYIEADNAHARQEDRDAVVATVAQKYLPPGMAKDKALLLLHQLKRYKFEVREYRHEGARNWPEGKLLPWEAAPHSDAATIKNLKSRYRKGESHFSAWKTYDTKRFIIENNVSIGFTIKDESGHIANVEAILWADSI